LGALSKAVAQMICTCALALANGAMAAGAVHLVNIEAMRFVPDRVEAAAGDVITWTNHDVVPHTVSAGGVMESGTIEAGKTWKLRVTRNATVDYVCRFHPGMRGKIVVK
jgi:plastocyanin